MIKEHREPVFYIAAAMQIVFQRPVNYLCLNLSLLLSCTEEVDNSIVIALKSGFVKFCARSL